MTKFGGMFVFVPIFPAASGRKCVLVPIFPGGKFVLVHIFPAFIVVKFCGKFVLVPIFPAESGGKCVWFLFFQAEVCFGSYFSSNYVGVTIPTYPIFDMDLHQQSII